MGTTQARTRRETQGAEHWALGEGRTLPGDCGVPQRPRNYFWCIAVSFLLSLVCPGYLESAILRFPAIASAAKTTNTVKSSVLHKSISGQQSEKNNLFYLIMTRAFTHTTERTA